MTLISFRTYTKKYIKEALHPELMDVISSPSTEKDKEDKIFKKIHELQGRKERIGTKPRNVSGSSRLYFKNTAGKFHAFVDGIKTPLLDGIKTAKNYMLKGQSAGAAQNRIENGNEKLNNQFRILKHVGTEKDLFGHKYKSFETNEEHGVLPPLFHHDSENHEWSHVGHVHDLKIVDREGSKKDDYFRGHAAFRKLTKTKSHPNGISLGKFKDTLMTIHELHKSGKDYKDGSGTLNTLDFKNNISHPLVKKFARFIINTGNDPGDICDSNLGVWIHPHTKKKHIVIRDSGYNDETSKLYWGK